MPIQLRFPGGEVVAFPDGTPKEYIRNLYREYQKYGGFEAVNQRTRLHNLRQDPDFLALPRIERQRRFNEEAKSTKAYWDQIAPEERRTLRELIVNDDEASEEETSNYWDAPFSRDEFDLWDKIEAAGALGFFPGGKTKAGYTAANSIAELGRAMEKSTPKVASFFTRSAGIAGEAATGFLQTNPTLPGIGPQGIGYTNPLFQTKTGGYLQSKGAKLNDAAKEIATDLSVGAELLAPPPRLGEFGDVHGWDDFSMYIAQAVGTQVPIMGSIVAAAAVPYVGPALAFGAGAGLETGSISEDLARAGFEGIEADTIAANYGVMAGALEAMPIANLLKRVPIVRDTLKKAIVARIASAGRQLLEEAGTEGLQTLVEQTAVDIAQAEKGELEKVSWLTPEGRQENLSNVIESMIQGALVGGGMGGLGPGGVEQGIPGDEDLYVPPFEEMPPIGQDTGLIEGPAGPVAPTGEELLPPAGGPEGPTISPEVRSNARWGAAPQWLPEQDRIAWAQDQEINLEEIVDTHPELTMETAILELEQAAEQAETLLQGGLEQAPQEDLSVIPEEEAAVEPEITAPVAPVPVPALEEEVTGRGALEPPGALEGGLERPTIEEMGPPAAGVEVQPTPEELEGLGVPAEETTEAEIDRIAAREMEPGEAPPGEVSRARYETTFKPAQKTRLKAREYAPAVGAAIAMNEGKDLTRQEVRRAVLDLTTFGNAGVNESKINNEIDSLVEFGVVEPVGDKFRVLPGRIDPGGFPVNEAGLQYGKEERRAQADIANQDFDRVLEDWNKKAAFLGSMVGAFQPWELNPNTGVRKIPGELEFVHKRFHAQKPAPGKITAGEGLGAKESLGEGADVWLERAIKQGILPPSAGVEDLAELLSGKGQNLGLGRKPQPARPVDFASLEKATKAEPPTVKDIRRTFKGWGTRQTAPGRYQLTRKGQPILQINFKDEEAFTDEQITNMAKSHKMSVEEVKTGLAAGTLVVKGHYTSPEVNGSHIIALIAPHATPDTLYHESFHFAFHNVLNGKQRQAVLEEYETEEAAAKAYEKLAKKHFETTTKLSVADRALQAIYDFAKAFSESIGMTPETAESIMKKTITGDIYKLQSGKYYTATDLSGAYPLKIIKNTILSAEEARKEADKEAKLAYDELDEALKNAKKTAPGFGKVPKVIAAELSPVERIASPDTFYSLEIGADAGDQHPAAMLPDETLTEHIRERAKRFLFQKIAPIFQVQEKLTEIGEDIQEAMDGFLKAQNFSARAGALIDWVELNLFKPFTDQLAAEGVSLSDFDLFRMAAHALERNPKIHAMHVIIPKQILEKKIAELEEKGLSTGMKVRAADRGNVGTIKAIDTEAGIADVYFHNPQTGLRATVTLPIDQLEREGIAKAKEKLAAIDKMIEDGEVPHSGIENDHAREILNEMRDLGSVTFDGDAGPNTTYGGKMGRISARFSKIVRWKENTLYKAGLLSKEELKKWRDYKHYAPMRGNDPDILDIIAGGRRLPIPEIEMYGGSMWHRAVARTARSMGLEREVTKRLGTGRGYNPGRRPAAFRALGRKTMPQHSATLELFTDAMESAVRGEKNRVAKTVWNFAQRFKNATDAKGEKLFEINRPAKRKIYDEKTGTVKEVGDGLSVTKDNVYNVWIDGKLYYIRHISPEMAPFISALNNIGPANIPAFLRGFTFVNREMSKLFTSRNPAFAIPNAFRDAITAGIKLAGEKQFEGFGLKTLKRAPAAWNLLREYGRRESMGTLNEMDQADRKRVEAFKLAGGETSFWMIPDLEHQMRRLQKQLGAAKKAGNEAASLVFVKQIIPFIEDYNGAIENATRFAVYERALEMGISKDKAARLARNITVDFTQQGTVARALTPFYIFANASLQGSKMVYDAVTKNPKAAAIVGSMVPMALTHALAMRALGGDDPEDGIPYWDKIGAYEKSRNLILMIPGTEGKRIKIPLPWGFNVGWMLGTTMADTVVGAVTPGEGAARVLSAGAGAFNPIGDNDLGTLSGWRQMIVPSWADPLNDVASNQTFWGGPIRPEKRAYKKSEQYGLEATDYNNYFSSVSKPSKEFTKLLYKYIGVDINPENLDYLAAGYFGGLGDLINRSVSLLWSLPKRKSVPMSHELPIVKSFYGDEGTFFAPQMYRANMAEHYLAWETFKDLEKTNKTAAHAFYRLHSDKLRMHDFVKATEKRVRELKARDVAVNDSRMQKIFKNFNRRYNSLEKKALRRRIKER